MKAIFAVTNATWAVVKNKAWKKFQACTGFETHDLCDAGVWGQATLWVVLGCRNYDKLQVDEPLGLRADLTFLPLPLSLSLPLPLSPSLYMPLVLLLQLLSPTPLSLQHVRKTFNNSLDNFAAIAITTTPALIWHFTPPFRSHFCPQWKNYLLTTSMYLLPLLNGRVYLKRSGQTSVPSWTKEKWYNDLFISYVYGWETFLWGILLALLRVFPERRFHCSAVSLRNTVASLARSSLPLLPAVIFPLRNV